MSETNSTSQSSKGANEPSTFQRKYFQLGVECIFCSACIRTVECCSQEGLTGASCFRYQEHPSSSIEASFLALSMRCRRFSCICISPMWYLRKCIFSLFFSFCSRATCALVLLSMFRIINTSCSRVQIYP